MRVEAAFSGVLSSSASKSSHVIPGSASAPTTMETGNTQVGKPPRSKYRLESTRSNVYFIFHKPERRRWMHCKSGGAGRASAANIEATLAPEKHHASTDSSSLEN